LKKTRLGVVVAEFNRNITNEMLKVAKNRAMERKAQIRYICFVPGTFDMPLIIEELIKKKDIDAIVTLGSVIKGDTAHDKLIANTAARFIAELSVKHQKPVSLGVTGPRMTVKQARDRISIVSNRAVDSAIDMVDRIRKLKNLNADFHGNTESIID
jgi:6,7-dimethyl-8-ribityllumazine synthase